MEARRRLLVYAAAVAAYAVLGVVLHRLWLMPLYSGDEKLYIEAGRLYLSGTPPIRFNMEHPPLAKYIIGACVDALGLGASYICPGLFTGLAAAAIAEAVYLATGSWRASVAVLAAQLLDPLYASLASVHLLDPYMLGFTALALLLYVRMLASPGEPGWGLAAATGAAAGAALASKMPCLYVLLPLLLHGLLVRRLRRATVLAAVVASLVYLASYAVDAARLGPGAIVEHHVRMLEYMWMRHSYTPLLALDGLLMYLFKTEAWVYVGSVTIVFNETVTTGGQVLIHPGRIIGSLNQHRLYIHTIPWAGSLLYILAPGYAALDALELLRRGRRALEEPWAAVLIAYLGSLGVLLHGPLWWYLALPAATGYALLGLHAASDNRLRALLPAGSIAAWLAWLLARSLHPTLQATLGQATP